MLSFYSSACSAFNKSFFDDFLYREFLHKNIEFLQTAEKELNAEKRKVRHFLDLKTCSVTFKRPKRKYNYFEPAQCFCVQIREQKKEIEARKQQRNAETKQQQQQQQQKNENNIDEKMDEEMKSVDVTVVSPEDLKDEKELKKLDRLLLATVRFHQNKQRNTKVLFGLKQFANSKVCHDFQQEKYEAQIQQRQQYLRLSPIGHDRFFNKYRMFGRELKFDSFSSISTPFFSCVWI